MNIIKESLETKVRYSCDVCVCGGGVAGIAAALRCENAYTAALASLWHGAAGQCGEKRFGMRGLTAEQLIACLHEAEETSRG